MKLNSSKEICLNIYDIRIDLDFIKDIDTINALLYECKYALFIFEKTNLFSFEIIKNLIKMIDIQKFPYLNFILIENKIELENSRKINENDINEYLKLNNFIKYIKISLKKEKNADFLKEIIKDINETKNFVSSDLILKSINKNNYILKTNIVFSFILLGDTSAGKTSFLYRYFKNKFVDEFPSIGIDKEICRVKIGKDLLKITLWDTAGRERFRGIPKKYYQHSDGFLIFFDVANEESFDNIYYFLEEIKKNMNIEKKQNIYLIGNKIDLNDRIISKERAESFAKSLEMKYFETSCKNNINIQEVMNSMIINCYINETKKFYFKKLVPYLFRNEKSFTKFKYDLQNYFNY